MTKPTKPAKQRIITTLSMEMAGVPENEQCMVYEHFETAIVRDIVLAVQDSTQTFEATYINLAGETVTETKREEHVETNDAWTKWLAEQRLASKYHVIKTRREYMASSAALTEDANTFEVIASMRRDDLIAQRQAEEKKNDKPAVKPKTPQKPQASVSQGGGKPSTQPNTVPRTGANQAAATEASPPVKAGAEPAPTPALPASPDPSSATAND